ncbi:MAG: carboxylating nicotinate-nucleotide diphosphorylase, partial [Pseudomonadota bacterium]|nr:carboxylating nicotinate-nucleotide diphosphorylase [Pseudomonadota bacterium]
MIDQLTLPAADQIRRQVAGAIAEDVGDGDLTAALLPDKLVAQAQVIARESGVICGISWFDEVFKQIDADVKIRWQVADGDKVTENQQLCVIEGRARSLLTAERTALNFLQSLSGTATQTSRYVQAVAGSNARILDTRKTIPGLRLAQKYAVRCGGGHNHRIGLYDAILIKENHIQAAASIERVLEDAELYFPGVETEIEVESLQELHEALDAGAKRVLLDNFSIGDLNCAVALNHGIARLEVSGGVTIESIRELAETGVDDISVGALTKHLHAFDLSML